MFAGAVLRAHRWRCFACVGSDGLLVLVRLGYVQVAGDASVDVNLATPGKDSNAAMDMDAEPVPFGGVH